MVDTTLLLNILACIYLAIVRIVDIFGYVHNTQCIVVLGQDIVHKPQNASYAAPIDHRILETSSVFCDSDPRGGGLHWGMQDRLAM